MKPKILPVLFAWLACCAPLSGQCPEDWVLHQSSPPAPVPFSIANSPYGITTDAENNIYTLSNIIGSVQWVDTQGAVSEVFAHTDSTNALVVAKHDPEGHFIWAEALNTAGGPHFHPDLILSGNQLILGGTYEDSLWFQGTALGTADGLGAIVAALHLNGQLIWTHHLAATEGNVQIYGLASDNNGAVFVTGRFSGTLELENGTLLTTLNPAFFFETFLLKLDSDGNLLWAVQSSSGIQSQVLSRGLPIAVTSNQDVILGGYFVDTLQFAPQPPVISGTTGGRNGFIAKFDGATGANEWTKIAVTDGNGSSAINYYDLLLDPEDNIFVLGGFLGTITQQGETLTDEGDYDAYLFKLDANGSLHWQEKIGGAAANAEWGGALTLTPHLTLLCALNLREDALFQNELLTGIQSLDLVVAEFSREGSLSAYEIFGGTLEEFSYGIHLDSQGQLVGIGETDSPVGYYGTDTLQVDTSRENSFLFKRCLNLVAVEEIPSLSSQIHPNPTSGELFIQIDAYTGSLRLDLYQTDGRRAWQSYGGDWQNVQLPQLAPGLYFLHLITETGQTYIHRLLIW